MGCGDLSLAVLRHSEDDLSRVLDKLPTSLSERNRLGQTPLHLAVGWPRGMHLLLEAGADCNATDHLGWVVLSYACCIECMETIQMLLDKKATFVGDRSQLFSYVDEATPAWTYTTTMALIPYISNQQIVDLILSAFVNRRKLFIGLARDFLGCDQVDQLITASDGIPDGNMCYLYDLLLAQVAIPQMFDTRLPGDQTIFHLAWRNSNLASKFWNLGFRNLEGYDAGGQTAMMRLFSGYPSEVRYVQMLSQLLWLYMRGASMFTKVKDGRRTALYFFARITGREPYHFLGKNTDATLAVIHQLRRETEIDAAMLEEDDCKCRCSTSSCTTHNVFIRTCSGYGWCLNGRAPCDIRYQTVVEWWIQAFCFGPDQQPLYATIKIVFRALIFELLELKHTCCDLICDEDRDDEIEEIHSEQAESYILLSTLVDIALSQWENETRPFSEFLEEFVETQIEAHDGIPSEEYVKKLEEIGVRVQEVEDY